MKYIKNFKKIILICLASGYITTNPFLRLAYVDVKSLKRNNIVTGVDGELWIQSFRQKTGTPVNVPISKMLGHSSIRTTQLYAKTMEKKISGDMALLIKLKQQIV